MPGPQTLQELLEKLRAAGIQLSLSGDRLRCNAPKNALTAELQEALARWKPHIIDLLARPQTDASMPLVHAPRDLPLPLSFAQQRLWVLNRIDPQSPAYNLPLLFRLSGRADRPAVAATLTEIARRHEVLRTTFDINQGQPTQRVSSPAPVRFEECDLRSEYALEGYRAVTRLAGAELRRPLNLSTGPVWRATLVRLDETLDCLLVILHHIISDGWSLAVFRKEFEQLYPTYRDGCPAVLPELTVQYVDFAFSQRQWLQGPEFQRQMGYWTQRLAGAPAALPLPTDRERPPISTYNGATRSSTLPPALSDAIKALGQREGATPFITLLAVFNVILHRYTGEEDILVGIPDGNRQLLELEPMQGLFVNTLVMRTDLSSNPSFRTLLQRVRQRVMEAYEHRDLPFESLVEALQPERNLSHPPLFQVMFVMQNTPLEAFARTAPAVPQGITVLAPARYDLTVYALETGSGLRLSLEYNTDLFDETTIARMEGHWLTLTQEILDKPDQGIRSLNLLTTPERRQLLDEWNQTAQEYPRDTHLHGLIEAQVLRTPDDVAAIDADGSLTYRELNQAANRLASRLHDLGIGPNARVAVLLPRSVELLVAVLGTLKAGAAYVPLDPSYPHDRIEFMLTDAEVAAVLTSGTSSWPPFPTQILSLKLDPEEVRSSNEAWETNPDSRAGPDSPAYVIYTSGSTGRPKGAMIPHRGVVNYLCWSV